MARIQVVLLPLLTMCSALLSLSSCGYQLEGSGIYLPEHIRKIAVPLFENRTYQYQLATTVTAAVADELSNYDAMKIVERSEADAVIEGSLISYTFRPVRISGSGVSAGLAESYRVSVTASVKLIDLLDGSTYWEHPSYVFSAEYDVPENLSTQADAELLSIEDATEDFAEDLVTMILQGF